MNSKAIEKYLERQNQARSIKEELDNKINYGVGSGNRWSPKLTKPEAPAFMQRYMD